MQAQHLVQAVSVFRLSGHEAPQALAQGAIQAARTVTPPKPALATQPTKATKATKARRKPDVAVPRAEPKPAAAPAAAEAGDNWQTF